LKVIGIDLDGPIMPISFYNPSVRLPWPLFFLLVPVIVFLKPNKQVVKKMQVMKDQGYQFMIVTARPKQFSRFTERLTRFHHIPFESLDCVGGGKGTKERKLKVIKEKRIEIFIDNDRRVLEFLKRNSVNVVNTLE